MCDGAFLIIGHPDDTCCGRVAQALQHLGHGVIRTSHPLTHPFSVRWRLGLEPSSDTNVWCDTDAQTRRLGGVLVRSLGGPVMPDEWDAKDCEYVRVESQAALLAWLWSLECPVVNRLSADLWVRPYRSYPEWRQAFAKSGLPTVSICITNDAAAARAWAGRWAGSATYAPLTSPQRYQLAEASDWDELSKVLQRMPVCLMAPIVKESIDVTIVGDNVVWDADTPAAAIALEPGLLRLARALRLAFFQVELACDGPDVRCVAVDPYPQLERHDSAAQAAIIACVVELLRTGDHWLWANGPGNSCVPRLQSVRVQ